MNESSNREVELFTEALQLPADGRNAYLKDACGENIALRRRIEKLLAAHSEIGDFLDDSPRNCRFGLSRAPGFLAKLKIPDWF